MKIKSNTTNNDLPWRFVRRDEVLWTGMRAATHWATRTTDFLPCHITTVARTGRRFSFIFFWRRPPMETETSR